MTFHNANALLDLHRYSSETRRQFLAELHRMRERLWVPHQVGLEYQRNRHSVAWSQFDAYSKIESAFDEAQNIVRRSLNAFKTHQRLDVEEFQAVFDSHVGELLERVRQHRDEHGEPIRNNLDADPIWREVTDLYRGKVGSAYDASRLSKIYQEGKQRYSHKVPPGYEDAGKGEPECYGDLVAWFQLLDHASSVNASVIFITRDAKEDWWRQFKGKTIGPRIELLEEFVERCPDSLLHFYTPSRFLKLAQERASVRVNGSAIEEVDALSATFDEDALEALIARRDEATRRLWEMQGGSWPLRRRELESEYLAAAKALESAERDEMHAFAALAAVEDSAELPQRRLDANNARQRAWEHKERLSELSAALDRARMEAVHQTTSRTRRERTQLLEDLATINEQLEVHDRKGTRG